MLCSGELMLALEWAEFSSIEQVLLVWVLARLCCFGGWNYLLCTILGVWILLPTQSNWDLRLSHHFGPELHLLGCWQVGGSSSVVCLGEGSIPGRCFANTSTTDLVFSAFELPVAHELPEYLLLLYYPLSISLSLIFPFLQLQNTFILTKWFRITKCWCRGMNNTGREWIFSGSRLLPSNCLLCSLIMFKLFEIAAPNKCY